MSNPFTDAIEAGPVGPPSLMRPRPDSLALGMVLAVILHTGIFVVGLTISLVWHPKVDPIKPDDAMEVSMMVLPHATRMPDKAMHVARSGTPDPTPQKSASPTKDTPPPPTLETSDLAFHDPNAKVTPSDTKAPVAKEDLAKKREEAMRRIMMEDALSDLDSPEGPKDRQATDPNSTSSEAIDLGGTGPAADPEIVLYLKTLKKLFAANFHPLPTIAAANPKIECSVRVMIDVDTGQVLSYEIESGKSSGNDSYDTSAMSAAAAVPKVPVPPEKFREKAREGFVMKFTPP